MIKSGSNARMLVTICSSVGWIILSQSGSSAQTRIVIDGSTGTAPLVAALGKAFASKGGAATEIGKGMGTKARLEALASHKIDIAMASHGLDVEAVRRRGMTVYPIAKTAVVFAANQSAKIGALAQMQVCAIFAGKIQNWKEVGGPDLAVAIFVRPESEVPTEVIRDGVDCLKAIKFPTAAKVMARGGDMRRALNGTAGAIGVASATDVEQSNGKIIAVAIDGIAPNETNVASGRYRLARDAFLVTRNDASAAVKAFISFVTSAEGNTVIRANGAIPVKK